MKGYFLVKILHWKWWELNNNDSKIKENAPHLLYKHSVIKMEVVVQMVT